MGKEIITIRSDGRSNPDMWPFPESEVITAMNCEYTFVFFLPSALRARRDMFSADMILHVHGGSLENHGHGKLCISGFFIIYISFDLC